MKINKNIVEARCHQYLKVVLVLIYLLMDLYDGIDTRARSSQIDGWSSGIKMLQTQLAVKMAVKKPVSIQSADIDHTIINTPYVAYDASG